MDLALPLHTQHAFRSILLLLLLLLLLMLFSRVFECVVVARLRSSSHAQTQPEY